MHRIALITLAALLTTACASSKRVVVDKQGIDEAQYQQDLTDCRAVADEVSTGRDAAEGAAGGAIIGGILGAIFGNSGTAGRMAGGGATSGDQGQRSRCKACAAVQPPSRSRQSDASSRASSNAAPCCNSAGISPSWAGGGRSSASASPLGVGTRKRAGCRKAQSSSKSRPLSSG